MTFEFTIHLDKRSNGFVLKHAFAAGWISDLHLTGDPADCEKVLAALQMQLRRSLRQSLVDSGVDGFEWSDIDRMVNVNLEILP